MEHATVNPKQTEHGKGTAPHARPAAQPQSAMHPAMEMQQQVGNQAMQQLLRAGIIHAKLSISQPDDPEEREADATADRIMRSHAGTGAAVSTCSCSNDEEMCDECRQKKAATISRKPTGNNAMTSPSRVMNKLRGSAGHPLDVATRAFFEPRFGQDLSHVRVHSDTIAASSAREIQAHAFAAGSEVYFAAGQYSPETDSGRKLLAHELTHVVQHATGSDPRIHRKYDDPYTLPPGDPNVWSNLKGKNLNDPIWHKNFEYTLNAAPQDAIDTEKDLQNNPDPKTDDDKKAAVTKIEKLIRLNALGMMASNRAGVQRKRDELLNQKPPGAGAKTQPAGNSAADNAKAIRAAAKEAVRLNEKKDLLQSSESRLRLESTSQLRSFDDPFMVAFKKLIDETNPYRTAEVQNYFAILGENLGHAKSLDRGTQTALIFNMGRYLADWRHKQVLGIVMALNQIYEQFPFMARLAPEDVPKEGQATDDQLMAKVKDAFAELLEKIDQAVIDIGRGKIEAFELKEAVKETKQSLPPSLKTILAQAMEDREVTRFWTDMGLTLAQVLLVFIPVVGPALAALLGLGQLAASVDDVVSKYEFSQASTSAEGGVLGVTGPSKLEWAMLGVQAALTAADLGGLWKEINTGRTHFTEAEPHLIAEEDAKITGKADEPVPGDKHPANIPGSPSEVQLHEEARTLRQEMRSPENVRDVIDEALVKDYDYQVSMKVGGEEHTYYHRRNGGWCRASATAFCGYSFGEDIEKALESIRQARRPSTTGKPTERYVQNELGSDFKPQDRNYQGKPVKGVGKYGMSISDFASTNGQRTVVEVKNIDIKYNMDNGFVDLRDQVGGYLSNVPHPDSSKFWLFMDVRGQKLPPGGFKSVIESVNKGTGHVFDNIFFITEAGLVVY
jgi:hypothetical protein